MTQTMLTDSNIHRFTSGEREIIVVGTAHVSHESARLVQQVIETEKPDTVCVELCQSRYQALKQSERWKETDIIKIIKEKKAFLLLSNLMLSSFQKRIAKQLNIKPGEEMLQAIETGERIGSGICLADRDIRVTMSRVWHAMGLWGKAKLLFQLLLSVGSIEEIDAAEIEKMKQADILESLLSELEKSLPVLRSILIDERDQYLAHEIQNAAGTKIVAVVGAGHVPGIKAHWNDQVDMAALNRIPPKKKALGFVKWGVPAAIGAVLIWGFFSGGANVGGHMVKWWILANGVLAGLGAALALAHPLTILASVLVSPLTSLNPMIAAGWVSGLVETFSRKPKVRDFERLTEDILSVKGFWRNKITRILLVVVFTNLGSALGAMVAIPLMLKIL